jgi:hypothetical protein
MATDPNDPRPVVDTRSGSRRTRLGLMTYGFVIGAIVMLVIVFVFMRVF